MSRAAFLFLLGMVSFSVYSQIKPKDQDWFFYDITYDYLLNAPANIEQSWRSNGHSFTFTDDVRFGEGSNFGFAYGLGFTSHNYYNNLNFGTFAGNGEEYYTLVDLDTVTSNKLTVQYIHIPLELRFRSDPNGNGRFFRWYLGAKVGVRVNSYSKLITDEVNRQYNDLGALNRFTYGVYTRIGYSFISFYAHYALSSIIEEQNIPNKNFPTFTQDLTPLQALNVGISFSL